MKYIEATKDSDPNDLLAEFCGSLLPEIAEVGQSMSDWEIVAVFMIILKTMGTANRLCRQHLKCDAPSIRAVISAPSEKIRLLTFIPRDSRGNELLEKKDRPILVFPASIQEVGRLTAEGYRNVMMCVVSDTSSEN